MMQRWWKRESWAWHAFLCFICLSILTLASPAPPARIAGSDPGSPISPGVRAVLWKEDFPEGWGSPLFLDDVLVLVHGDGIEGRDAMTGHELWNIDLSTLDDHDPPEELAATGDYVVSVVPHANVDTEDPSGDSLLAFNSRTGAILWNLLSGLYGSDTPLPYLDYIGVGRNRVLIHIPSMNTVRALDIVNGKLRWEVSLPSGCTSGPSATDESVAALLITCGPVTSLRVLDPATGRLLWQRKVVVEKTTLVTVSGGAIGVESDNAFTVYDVGGHLLYEHTAERTCTCTLAATAPGLLIVRQSNVSDTHAPVTEVVDLRRGRVTRVGDEVGGFGMVSVIDGRIYGSRPLGSDLKGSIVVMIDPVTGRQTPVTTFPIHEELVSISPHTLLIDPGLDEDSSSLIAYRTIPPSMEDPGIVARAGVAREQWPDACALLLPSSLAEEFPKADYAFVARKAPPEFALSTPTGCDFVPDDNRHPALTLSVLWVGRTPTEAETVLKALVGNFRQEPDRITNKVSGARLYTDRNVKDMAIVRVGDTIVRLDGARGRAATMRLITKVVHVLRRAA